MNTTSGADAVTTPHTDVDAILHAAARRRYPVPALPPAAAPAPRTSLAEQQVALVAALTGNGPVPAGFDTQRIQAAGNALAAKRARAVAQVWPCVRTMLDTEFRTRFDAYAAQAPLPELGGPLADGRAFIRALATQMPLADDVVLQALGVDQRWKGTARGLVPRRLPHIGFARLRNLHSVIIAFGTREVRVALPRLRR